MKDSEVAFLTLNWFFRSQRRSFCIAFILNNLYLAHCLFSYVSLGKHWIMRKFEEYLINVRLKANLDQLVVMHAILMIWNFKGKRIVTSFLFCFVFFFKKKKSLSSRPLSSDIARKSDTHFVEFFSGHYPFRLTPWARSQKWRKINCF